MKISQHIIVTDYDPSWREKFEEESLLIRDILADNCIAVYHIGSTSVPGLAAKLLGRHLAFRDYMRTHEKERNQYAKMKKALAQKSVSQQMEMWSCPADPAGN